jgi:trans-aconitate methyltransferase
MTTPETTDHWSAEQYRVRHAFVYESSRDLVADWLTPQPGECILDVGCGTGELTAQIAGVAESVHGIDASAQMIAGAQDRHTLSNLSFAVLDAHDLPDAEFNAVFSNAALHWMAPLESVFAGIARSLVPGGRLALEMGGGDNVLAVRESVEQALAEQGLPMLKHPWIFPSPAELATLLEQAGFTVQRLHLFERPSVLSGADSFRAWLDGFGSGWLAPLSAAARAAVIHRAEELARPKLWNGSDWVADYVRLRALAVQRGG